MISLSAVAMLLFMACAMSGTFKPGVICNNLYTAFRSVFTPSFSSQNVINLLPHLLPHLQTGVCAGGEIEFCLPVNTADLPAGRQVEK